MGTSETLALAGSMGFPSTVYEALKKDFAIDDFETYSCFDSNASFTIANSNITATSVITVSYFNSSNEIISHAITRSLGCAVIILVNG
jgi:hypothetical protein